MLCAIMGKLSQDHILFLGELKTYCELLHLYINDLDLNRLNLLVECEFSVHELTRLTSHLECLISAIDAALEHNAS